MSKPVIATASDDIISAFITFYKTGDRWITSKRCREWNIAELRIPINEIPK